ncbi:MAG: UDP-N-acetylglucosamine pyrophosphorylase [Nannocystaceae bacterium]
MADTNDTNDRPSVITDVNLRLRRLADHKVTVVDPRQTWIDANVDLERIAEGVVLHPGTRIEGSRTLLSHGAVIGREGPATLVDCVLGTGARIDSGYANNAVLLAGASAGANAHLRDGTILEEQACTAHAVGLKHTILLCFVTLGSQINFCDCLMAGGTSRKDHSEVGSGYIHFNFTPWGRRGDKATPSLFGDVPRGVFLRESRIFLGGSAGAVGPRHVGFGGVAVAGQVLRQDIGDERIVGSVPREINQSFTPHKSRKGTERKKLRNLIYIGNLHALGAWYEQVRIARITADQPFTKEVMGAAQINIDRAILERRKRLDAALEEWGEAPVRWSDPEVPPCPIKIEPSSIDHLRWIQALEPSEIAAGSAWLRAIVDSVVGRVATTEVPPRHQA